MSYEAARHRERKRSNDRKTLQKNQTGHFHEMKIRSRKSFREILAAKLFREFSISRFSAYLPRTTVKSPRKVEIVINVNTASFRGLLCRTRGPIR